MLIDAHVDSRVGNAEHLLEHRQLQLALGVVAFSKKAAAVDRAPHEGEDQAARTGLQVRVADARGKLKRRSGRGVAV